VIPFLAWLSCFCLGLALLLIGCVLAWMGANLLYAGLVG
jgi:hypothetical protein